MIRFSQVALIQNLASGNGDESARIAVRNELAAAGNLWRELVVEPERSMASRTSELLREGVDLIVVAGGDGTVREVASTLVGKTVPLLVIPLGTFNNFALDRHHQALLGLERPGGGPRQAHVDAALHDGCGDHENDEEHERHIDERGDVDIGVQRQLAVPAQSTVPTELVAHHPSGCPAAST